MVLGHLWMQHEIGSPKQDLNLVHLLVPKARPHNLKTMFPQARPHRLKSFDLYFLFNLLHQFWCVQVVIVHGMTH